MQWVALLLNQLPDNMTADDAGVVEKNALHIDIPVTEHDRLRAA